MVDAGSELDGITKYLRILLDGEEDLHENRTCVLVPNKRWALMAQQVLKQRGFAVALAGAFSRLGGDPRDSARAARSWRTRSSTCWPIRAT